MGAGLACSVTLETGVAHQSFASQFNSELNDGEVISAHRRIARLRGERASCVHA
jgi:hypothetical protein